MEDNDGVGCLNARVVLAFFASRLAPTGLAPRWNLLIIPRLPDIETGMTAIHIKFPSLTLKAGPRAFARIRENGLNAVDVGTLPGAAGGPKALGIQGLDLALFGEWLPAAPRERSLIGASVGSWRFASACLPDAA